MKKIDKIINFDAERFKRVVGVKPTTFQVMVEEYKASEIERKKTHKVGGRQPKLCEEDRFLLMLEYYREYRTLDHIGIDYGISEGHASKTVRAVEKVLIKSGKLSLPGKKVLHDASNTIEYIVVDATESQIQRPKKSSENTIQARRNNILKKLK
tara:strand:- start:64 stop:525 length:462 start_codon:yes stop_codon:yes gene_type:complete